jgi:hypothetical protein
MLIWNSTRNSMALSFRLYGKLQVDQAA